MGLSTLLKDDPHIKFLAGAGLSAPPPTCLPGWWALNDSVLRALGGAIERIADRPGLSDGFRDAVRQRRESTPFLMPDLQAQLLEDELGPAYFQSLSALDSEEPGNWAAADEHSHEAEAIYREIGDLPGEIFAKRERVRALVGAAVEAGQLDAAQFDELNETLQRFAIENAPGLRPLIKFELARLATFFDEGLARSLAADAAEDAELQHHPVLVTAARELRNSLSTP